MKKTGIKKKSKKNSASRSNETTENKESEYDVRFAEVHDNDDAQIKAMMDRYNIKGDGGPITEEELERKREARALEREKYEIEQDAKVRYLNAIRLHIGYRIFPPTCNNL